MKEKVILKVLGDRVREYRTYQGLSQEELAKKSSLHRTYIGGIERGERNVSLLNIQRIASALKKRVPDLLR
jgi:transcriptional regulator with XRE-family HTH domain